MSGRRIVDTDLGSIFDNMKIPVGSEENAAITPKMIFNHLVGGGGDIFVTNNPAIEATNGFAQHLDLISEGVLTYSSVDTQSVFLKVTGDFPLDYSAFINVNGYVRDSSKESFIVILDWLTTKFLFGFDLIP